MNKAIFHLKRQHYGRNSTGLETTLGSMLRPDGTWFCEVLEDVVRAFGIKSKAYTAIPATENDDTYHLKVMQSPKYGEVVTVFTHMEGDVPVLIYGGIRFEYIRCHGGNDADDTEGCLLVNKYSDNETMSAWESMKDEFVKEVKALEEQGYDVRLRITNLPQSA